MERVLVCMLKLVFCFRANTFENVPKAVPGTGVTEHRGNPVEVTLTLSFSSLRKEFTSNMSHLLRKPGLSSTWGLTKAFSLLILNDSAQP